MRENDYQAHLIKRLHKLFHGCIILKNDTDYIQGIPDLTVLYYGKWAVLEVKASAKASTQPNQEWYINELNRMSFAAFIYPENEEEILDDLQRALKPHRSTRISVGL